MPDASSAVFAKARAISGRFLTTDDYMALLSKPDISSVIAYLKNTPRFSECFREVNEKTIHRAQAEALIEKDVFSIYRRLWRFSTQKGGLYGFLLKKLETEQLMNIIYCVNSDNVDNYIAMIPTFLLGENSFDMMALASVKTFDDILTVIKDTPYYKVLKPVLPAAGNTNCTKLDFNDCSLVLQLYYYKWAFKELKNSGLKKSEQKELKEIIVMQTDLDNLLTSYRMRSYFKMDTDSIAQTLLPYHYRVTVAQIEAILDDSDAENNLRNLLKKRFFKDNIEFDENNLEIAVRRYNHRFFRTRLAMTQSGMIAFYSLMMLLEIEKNNVTTIIEGIRYSVPSGDIERLLVI